MSRRQYICKECGTNYSTTTEGAPPGIKWSDGHICKPVPKLEEGGEVDLTIESKKGLTDISAKERKGISTLIDKLAKLGKEAQEKGEKAPNYNLCEVSIPGTNLYCDDNKGISRENMPQFKGPARKGSFAATLPKNTYGEADTEAFFLEMLKRKGIKISEPFSMQPDLLKSTQSELKGVKVANMSKVLKDTTSQDYKNITAPIFISKDGYVLDGHHRWASIVAYNSSNIDNPLNMKVRVIDMKILPLVKLANDFAQEIGVQSVKGSYKKGGKLLNHIYLSPSEYQQAKKLKDFKKEDYKWISAKDLYVRREALNEDTVQGWDEIEDERDIIGMEEYAKGGETKKPTYAVVFESDNTDPSVYGPYDSRNSAQKVEKELQKEFTRHGHRTHSTQMIYEEVPDDDDGKLKFYLTDNSNNRMGKDLVKKSGSKYPKVFKSYKEAHKEMKEANDFGWNNYRVTDIDMEYIDNKGRRDDGEYSLFRRYLTKTEYKEKKKYDRKGILPSWEEYKNYDKQQKVKERKAKGGEVGEDGERLFKKGDKVSYNDDMSGKRKTGYVLKRMKSYFTTPNPNPETHYQYLIGETKTFPTIYADRAMDSPFYDIKLEKEYEKGGELDYQRTRALGTCYEDSIRMAQKSIEDELEGSPNNTIIYYGMVKDRFNKEEFLHSWVKRDDVIYDSRYRKPIDKETFNELNEVKWKKSYTPKEVVQNVREKGEAGTLWDCSLQERHHIIDLMEHQHMPSKIAYETIKGKDLQENKNKEENFPIDPNNITKNELHEHFDLNNDGKVTSEEYKEHIKYHCDNPQTLDKTISERLLSPKMPKGLRYNLAKGGKLDELFPKKRQPPSYIKIFKDKDSPYSIGIIFWHSQDIFGFPGKFYVWAYEDDKSINDLYEGKIDMVIFPMRRRFTLDTGDLPLRKVWHKNYQKRFRGSEKLIGIIEGEFVKDKKMAYLDMMTVRKDQRRKGVNEAMIKELREFLDIKKDQVEFVDKTKEGEKFEKSGKFDRGGYTKQGEALRSYLKTHKPSEANKKFVYNKLKEIWGYLNDENLEKGEIPLRVRVNYNPNSPIGVGRLENTNDLIVLDHDRYNKGGETKHSNYLIKLIEKTPDSILGEDYDEKLNIKSWRGVVDKQVFEELETLSKAGGYDRFSIEVYNKDVADKTADINSLERFMNNIGISPQQELGKGGAIYKQAADIGVQYAGEKSKDGGLEAETPGMGGYDEAVMDSQTDKIANTVVDAIPIAVPFKALGQAGSKVIVGQSEGEERKKKQVVAAALFAPHKLFAMRKARDKARAEAEANTYAKGGATNEAYVDFRNKKKGFSPDRKYFKTYEEAEKWARKEFDSFNSDMIGYTEFERPLPGYKKGGETEKKTRIQEFVDEDTGELVYIEVDLDTEVQSMKTPNASRQRSIRKMDKKREKLFRKMTDKQYDLDYLYDELKEVENELNETFMDQEHEAGQKGEEWSDEDGNRYGAILNKLEKRKMGINKLITIKKKELDEISQRWEDADLKFWDEETRY